jgi:hypothetical protein
MQKAKAWKKYVGDQKGAVLILVAICFVVLLGFAALAIDVGYLMAARNELQNVADAAALAACRELGEQYYLGHEINEPSINSVAMDVAEKNNVARQPVIISEGSIEIGWWDPDSNEFYPIKPEHIWYKKNSVRVTASRDDSQNGKITTFFARVLGIDAVSLSARATAALTGASELPEGESIPVGISNHWFDYEGWEDDGFCNQPIKFYPTGTIEGCAGWHTFEEDPASANTLRNILEGMLDGDPSPEMETGHELVFIGGNVASALCNPDQVDFEELWLAADKNIDGDWVVRVAVYEMGDCSNPTGEIPILGFTTAYIHSVECQPTQEINATVKCDEITDARGGGGMYGTFGRIPGLVE